MRILIGVRMLFVIGMLLGSTAIVASQVSAATYIDAATIHVGGTLYGIAVDPTTNSVYVANASDNSVSVIDGATNTVTATIDVGSPPNSVAVNPVTNTVYVVNGVDNSVSAIDGATNTVTATIGVGSGPVSVAVNPIANTAYTANWNDKSVSVINGVTNTVTTTIDIRGYPSSIAVNPITNRAYVSNVVHYVGYGFSDVTVIDGATNTVDTSVGVAHGATGVAVNPTNNQVYVFADDNHAVLVIDGATNSRTTMIDVLGFSGIAVNPRTNWLYLIYADTVSVIGVLPVPTTPSITNLPGSGAFNGSFTPVVSTTGDGSTSVTSSTTSVCTVASGTVHYIGVGTCTLVAHVATGTNYDSADGSNQSFGVRRTTSSAPSIPSAKSAASSTLLATWSQPSNNGGSPISSYTATASPGGQKCTTSGTSCTISNLDPSTPYTVRVVATNESGSSLPSLPSMAIYAVAAESIKVKVVPFVVATKSPFTVLAYGAPANKTVTLAVPGSQRTCKTNGAGQCTVSLSVKNTGLHTALAILGSKTTSSTFYAPAIAVPLVAKHGQSFTVGITRAPTTSQVTISLSDGRTKLATTSGVGAVFILVPALKAGLLKVSVSIAGVSFKSSTVLVS